MEIIDLRSLKPAHEMGAAARAVCLPMLLPLSLIYGGIMRLWRKCPARSVDAGIPVVSVGSILVGGTGKTPLAILIAGGLSERGFRVCILSRGYMRKGGKSPSIVSDGAGSIASVEEAGDEPYLMARRLPGVGVVVGSDRVAAAREAGKKLAPEVFVLDDGFQYRRLSKSVEVLTFDAGSFRGRQYMLPLGRLREPWGWVERGDMFVVLEEAEDCQPESRRRSTPSGLTFRARYDRACVIDALGGEVGAEATSQARALVLSGIARPAGFERTCRLVGVEGAVAVRAGDHHWYGERDTDRVLEIFERYRCTRILTTEKDFWKLPRRLMEVAWFVRADLKIDESQAFWDALLNRVGGLR